jgi:hypothetical protein
VHFLRWIHRGSEDVCTHCYQCSADAVVCRKGSKIPYSSGKPLNIHYPSYTHSTSDTAHTKFEILPLIEYTKDIATFEAFPPVSFVEPGGAMKITIRLTPLKLGQFKIPLIVSIAGSVDPPLQTLLSCTCIGPSIVLDQTEVCILPLSSPRLNAPYL